MRLQNTGQQHFINQTPFLRLLIPCIGGIVTEKYFPVQNEFTIPLFGFSALLLYGIHRISVYRFFGMSWIPGLVIQIIFFSLGRILIEIHRDKNVETSSVFVKDQPNCLLVGLISDPVPKNKSFKSMGMVRWLIRDGNCFREDEKILIYFPKTIDPVRLSSGSRIIMKKALQPIENQKESGFDYKKYCAVRHIGAQVFLRENEFDILAPEQNHSLTSGLEALRRRLLIIIKNQIPAKSENSLLEALMVGYTDDLDPALLKSYADSGVIHIIAISGLHLALICHLLQFVLKKTGNRKSILWMRLIAILGCLWAYSLLSGASLSVIRSAAMFSLVLLARNLSRESNLYNTLAASAFLLLCFDPNWLWDTGFQLSYAAVLSLGLFSKPIRTWINPHNKLLGSLWQASSVSIAAQILTTPVSIYYFHRFPTYFLIANLLAVPLSSAVLLGGIGLCLFNWIPPLATGLGWLLGLLIRMLNGFIQFISKIPGAVIPELTLSPTQLILVYIIIFSFYRFIKRKEKPWVFAALALICVFMVTRLFN